jgi:hypothetical protein
MDVSPGVFFYSHSLGVKMWASIHIQTSLLPTLSVALLWYDWIDLQLYIRQYVRDVPPDLEACIDWFDASILDTILFNRLAFLYSKTFPLDSSTVKSNSGWNCM